MNTLRLDEDWPVTPALSDDVDARQRRVRTPPSVDTGFPSLLRNKMFHL
jgi:hypothetical protein